MNLTKRIESRVVPRRAHSQGRSHSPRPVLSWVDWEEQGFEHELKDILSPYWAWRTAPPHEALVGLAIESSGVYWEKPASMGKLKNQPPQPKP